MRAYVDTSVFGGVFDEEFKYDSLKFFEQVKEGKIVVVLSAVTEQELSAAPLQVRSYLESLPNGTVVRTPLSIESSSLADEYIKHGAVSYQYFTDALHIAVATMSSAEVIVSWNFKHMVNLFRIRRYNSVNVLLGYRSVEIRSPRDVIYE